MKETDKKDMWIAQLAAMEATKELEEAKVSWDREIDIFSIIENAGLPLLFRPLKHLSGAYIPANESSDLKAGILINSDHPRSRQRYTAAHEYAHHIQDQTMSLDRETEIVGRTQQRMLPEHERFAEVFASWFLMPPQLIGNIKKALGINFDYPKPEDIYQLSLVLGTSYRAIITQLVALKEISWTQANRLRKWQPKDLKERISLRRFTDTPWNDIWEINKHYNGRSIHPKVGDELRLCLEETPSTGYIWISSDWDPAIILVDQRFVESEGEKIGEKGRREFNIKPEYAGESSLSFSLQRPWLGKKSEVDSFHIQLIIESEYLGVNPKLLLVEA